MKIQIGGTNNVQDSDVDDNQIQIGAFPVIVIIVVIGVLLLNCFIE